ncbi:MAG: hypothetical protein ACSW8A_08155 [Lachnospiraceae bacterium]
MDGKYMGFIIWVICGCFLIGIGIYDMFSKKQANFWANIRPFQVKDVKGYNRATGLLFIGYGLVFILLGLPLLAGQNNPLILISLLGVMLETIALMAIYILVITKKYKDQ